MIRTPHPTLMTIAITLSLGLSACGYTNRTALPEYVQTVHVRSVTNKIDLSESISNDKAFQTYRPGLDVELRNALIERFVFDGHLRIANENNANAIVEMDLLAFDRDPLRYNQDDSIQEFRINVKAAVRMRDVIKDEILWETPAISGNAEYFTSGRLARTEDQVVAEALEDLSRNIVERILEEW
ncbi:MAG: hypothetical protein ACI9CF_001477 [Candidatus Omnitrophota bacterium]|jgi:hypothetical protein